MAIVALAEKVRKENHLEAQAVDGEHGNLPVLLITGGVVLVGLLVWGARAAGGDEYAQIWNPVER
jgi:hypothetical protein